MGPVPISLSETRACGGNTMCAAAEARHVWNTSRPNAAPEAALTSALYPLSSSGMGGDSATGVDCAAGKEEPREHTPDAPPAPAPAPLHAGPDSSKA